MKNKARVATGYPPYTVDFVKATTLYIATKLGDLRDDVVLVGGLVPSLLMPESSLLPGKSPHIGTMDVDLGLAVAIFDEQRYQELCERLRQAGFEPDMNERGNSVHQRWKIEVEGHKAIVDFLIPATLPDDKPGTLRHFEKDFAAIIMPGLELAFMDKRLITLKGKTIRQEEASREIWVCEAGAFLILKSLAFKNRGENKDAYDLAYLLQNYGNGIDDIFRRFQPFLQSIHGQESLLVLKRDFADLDSVGTKRVAEFLGDSENMNLRADVAGPVRSFLRLCT